MAFQFFCPQGHLLEAERSNAGAMTVCPECGAKFEIPGSPQTMAGSAASLDELVPGVGLGLADELGGGAGLGSASAEHLLHIPCPNGHALETPLDMVGQYALCPHCGVQFHLRKQDSLEHRDESDRLAAKRARIWFKASIGSAVVVGLLLCLMIVYMIAS